MAIGAPLQTRGGTPRFKDFDILDVSDSLPSLVIFRVSQDPLDFVYRFVGSEVESHNTDSFTGEYMSALPGKDRQSGVWRFFHSIYESGKPTLQQMPYVGKTKDFETIEILVLPLFGCDDVVNHMIVTTDYFSRE